MCTADILGTVTMCKTFSRWIIGHSETVKNGVSLWYILYRKMLFFRVKMINVTDENFLFNG